MMHTKYHKYHGITIFTYAMINIQNNLLSMQNTNCILSFAHFYLRYKHLIYSVI